MKLVVFLASAKRLGAIVGDNIVDLNLAYAKYLAETVGESNPYALANATVPTSLHQFIEGGQKSIGEANKAIAHANRSLKTLAGPGGEKAVYGMQEVKLLAPIPNIGAKTVAMGGNFRAHRAEARGPSTPPGREEDSRRRLIPEEQIRGFMTHTSCIIGPDDPVIFPPLTKMQDYEVECVAIMGTRSKNIPKEKAQEHIFGYTVSVDVCTRDERGYTREPYIHFVRPSKNYDCSKPMGPCILVKEPGVNIYDHRMEMKVNGQLRQETMMSEMIYNFEDIIEFFSEDWTWNPGDMIWSGTCSGTAMGQQRQFNDLSWWIKPGDQMEATIEGIGVLKNKFISKV